MINPELSIVSGIRGPRSSHAAVRLVANSRLRPTLRVVIRFMFPLRLTSSAQSTTTISINLVSTLDRLLVRML